MISCPICSTTLRDNYHLSQHTKANHDCKSCGKTFSDKNYLKAHTKVCFEKAKADPSCNKCGKRFKHKGHYNVHISTCKQKTIEETKYECLICYPNKTFVTQTTLENHLRHHERDKSFHCEECSKAFYTEASYKQHYKLHIKSYWCNLCHTKFTTKGALTTHEKNQHNSKFPTTVKPACLDCGKTYVGSKNLKKHIKTKHGDSIKATISCPKCKLK